MAIPSAFISQLKMSCDIESVISSYISLKRAGRNTKALCPFHSEKTPSFTVYNDTQSYYCFGCGAGGDVITFIMQIENVDYVEAVKILASRVGMTLPEDQADDRAAKLRQKVYEINREAARYFHSMLHSQKGKAGLEYFAKRGLTPKTIKTYGLGYAPDGWDNLKNHLLEKGFTLSDMYAAAVVSKSKNDTYYDKFRNRVMFPIIDLRGNVTAFSGRVLDDSKPKYINTDDTPVYKKSRTLFSMNFAKNENGGRIILAEGNLDVISLYQAGFTNAVASCGTALTSEQARMISQYASEVVIAYDSDSAGRIATQKASRLFDETGIKIKVLNMSGAKDPDEYIKKYGATRFKLLLDGSESVTEYQLERIKSEFDTDSAEGRLSYLNRAAEYLATLKNPIERELYAGRLADETSVSKDTITSRVDSVLKKNVRAKKKREWNDIAQNKQAYSDRINPQRARNLREAKAEEGIIAYLYKNPDSFEHINSRLSPDDFVTDFNKKIFGIFYEYLQNNITPDLGLLADKLLPEEMGRVSGMLAKIPDFGSATGLDDYIDILLEHKNKLTPEKTADMSPQELFEEIKKRRKHS